jgi:hypothetical protein
MGDPVRLVVSDLNLLPLVVSLRLHPLSLSARLSRDGQPIRKSKLTRAGSVGLRAVPAAVSVEPEAVD